MKTVRDLMSRDVVTVTGDMTVRDLARLLSEEEITGAPVVDSHGEVVGVVSSSDILQLAGNAERFEGPARESDVEYYYRVETEILPDLRVETPWLDWNTFEDRTVGEIMNPVRYAVNPDTSIEELATFLLEKRVHRALVIENEELAGIVTTYDVLRGIVDGIGAPA